MRVHRWRDCRPVLLELDGPELDEHDLRRQGAALAAAWSRVPDEDRQMFHLYCCFSLHTPETLAAVERIGALLRAAMDSGGEGSQEA